MSRSWHPAKPRTVQGELRNLTSYAREPLHAWLREKAKPVTYEEIRRRLKAQFGIQVSAASLSRYYDSHFQEIHGTAQAEATHKTIIIRIEVPAGCSVDVSTESKETEEK